MALTLDHLVVGAATLDAGRAWARERLGAEPISGGQHAGMGTHNLVLRLDGATVREAYLEILAIDPEAPDPSRPRWFDLDVPEVRAAVAVGPRLLAWVARSDAIEADRERLVSAGFDPGVVRAAQRSAPDRMLRWRITIRDDGARLVGGAVPALIAWDSPSPAVSLPGSGTLLEGVVVRGVPTGLSWLSEVAGLTVDGGGAPRLGAVLRGPEGRVELVSA